MNPQQCEQWLINRQQTPIINPLTGYEITFQGPTYHILEKMCGLEKYTGDVLPRCDMMTYDEDLLELINNMMTPEEEKELRKAFNNAFGDSTAADHYYCVILNAKFDPRSSKEWAKNVVPILIRLAEDYSEGTHTPEDEWSELPVDFYDADPTGPKKKYLDWIIQSYLRGGIKRFEDIGSKVKEALEDWIYLGKVKKLEGNERIITNFCGLEKCSLKKGGGKSKKGYDIPTWELPLLGLYDVLDKHQELLDKRKSQTSAEVKKQIENETEVYTGKDVRIFQPKSKESACHYGQGTRWCTAATKGDNRFKTYYEQGPLYIVIPNKPTRRGEKYQIHIQSDQVMDEQDHDYDIFELFHQFPELLAIEPLKQYILLKEYFKRSSKHKQNSLSILKLLIADGLDINYINKDTGPIKTLLSSLSKDNLELYANELRSLGADPGIVLKAARELYNNSGDVSSRRNYSFFLDLFVI